MYYFSSSKFNSLLALDLVNFPVHIYEYEICRLFARAVIVNLEALTLWELYIRYYITIHNSSNNFMVGVTTT